MEITETTRNAALRELKEETGIDLRQNLNFIGIYDAVNRDPRKRVISAVYGAVVGEELEGEAGDDASAMGWYNFGALPPLAFDHDKIIEDAIIHLSE